MIKDKIKFAIVVTISLFCKGEILSLDSPPLFPPTEVSSDSVSDHGNPPNSSQELLAATGPEVSIPNPADLKILLTPPAAVATTVSADFLPECPHAPQASKSEDPEIETGFAASTAASSTPGGRTTSTVLLTPQSTPQEEATPPLNGGINHGDSLMLFRYTPTQADRRRRVSMSAPVPILCYQSPTAGLLLVSKMSTEDLLVAFLGFTRDVNIDLLKESLNAGSLLSAEQISQVKILVRLITTINARPITRKRKRAREEDPNFRILNDMAFLEKLQSVLLQVQPNAQEMDTALEA